MKKNSIIYLFLISLFLSACGTGKKVVSATIKDKTYHLKANFRMKEDSVIWLSVSAPFGIEVSRLLLTPDSVFYLNRLEKNYYKGNYAFLCRLLQTDVDFDIIQSLLTGRDVKWYDHQSLKVHTKGKHYQLESAHRRRLKRYAKRNDGLNPVFYQSVWLTPQHYKIKKIKMKTISEQDVRKLLMTYDDFKQVDAQQLPHKYNLEITSDEAFLVEMQWKRIQLNKPTRFPFSIPSSYKN
ncbi:MAG: hypothetical protein CSB02_00495 [Bacteroidia bacterium]|nr:MAG: hypothetical protein CSB02_00495 [Bacteroidia bacterium]